MRLLPKQVVCLVEPGWQGIRKLTISLASEGVASLCIIKGKLNKEVLGMISEYNEISLKPVKRDIFKLYIFVTFLINAILRNVICVVMDSKKNYPWVSALNRALGIKTFLLAETGRDYRLFLGQTPQDIKFILDLAKGQR